MPTTPWAAPAAACVQGPLGFGGSGTFCPCEASWIHFLLQTSGPCAQVGIQVAGGGILLDAWECGLSAQPCLSGRVAPRTSQLVGQPPASICVTGGRRGHTQGAVTHTPAPWPLGASSRL